LILVLMILLLVVLLVVYFWVVGRKPHIHKGVSQMEIPRYLETLLHRGYDQGFVIIRDPQSDKFIQFAKYIDDVGRVGLRFDFPLAPWSSRYYQKLKDAFMERDILFEVVHTGESPVEEFVAVDVGDRLPLARNIVRLVLQEVFEVASGVRFNISFERVSPKNELVSSLVGH